MVILAARANRASKVRRVRLGQWAPPEMLDPQGSRAREERLDLPEQAATVERLAELELLELQGQLEQLEALVLRVELAIPEQRARLAPQVNRVSREPADLPGLQAIAVPLESRVPLGSRALRVNRVRKVKLDL